MKKNKTATEAIMEDKEKRGFSGLYFEGMPIYYDPDCPTGTVYFMPQTDIPTDLNSIWGCG